MNTMQRREDMRDQILKGDILKTTLNLAWPVMLSNAFQTVYNLTDAYWLGKIGPEHLPQRRLRHRRPLHGRPIRRRRRDGESQ